ncbi:MAG TPA: ribonuclease Z [Gemmatimonadaceae bacterium]|nr:ribonuclease Z [Gemmatimonadaceae bacterium]
MSLSLRFLGTVASRPTVERSVASLTMVREGETLMFDCGEGTQRQMMRYGVSFALSDIFITHWHHDHFLGLLGFVRTLALQGRTDVLRVYGPRGGVRVLRAVDSLGHERLPFELKVEEIEGGWSLDRGEYTLNAFTVDHAGSNALGFALVERDRRGRFNVDLARELGVPEGPMWGRIHKGENITLDNGRIVESSALVGPARRGRTVVYTGDTRPCAATMLAAEGADLLVHEATFGDEEAERAKETGHSTAREAAEVAKRSGVRRLVLTHVSARYSKDYSELEQQSRQLFPGTTIARDGMEVEVPFVADATPFGSTP